MQIKNHNEIPQYIRILKQKIPAITAVGKNTEPLALFYIAVKGQNDTVIFKKKVDSFL